jgi:hypothetical protein
MRTGPSSQIPKVLSFLSPECEVSKEGGERGEGSERPPASWAGGLSGQENFQDSEVRISTVRKS